MEKAPEKNLSVEDIMLQSVRAKKAAEKPVVEPIVEPVVEPKVEVDPIIPEDKDLPVEPIVDPLKDKDEVEPKVDEPKVEEPEIVEPKIELEWDIKESEVNKDEPKKIDISVYKEIGDSLGLEDASSKEDLLDKLSKYKESIEKDSGKKFDSIPEDLKKAIEVHELGGEYKALFSETDYSAIDPKAFFIEAAKEHFIGADGNLEVDSLQDFIDTQDPKMIDIQGAAIKKQYVEQQEAKKQAAVSMLRQRKELTEAKLKTALKEFNTYNEFEVNETHKKQLYEDITTGKAMKEMFYDSNGEYDMGKVTRAYFHYLKGDQMESFRSQRAKSAALREVIDDASNADVNVNGRKVTSNSKVDRPHPFDFMAKKYGMIPDEDK